MSPHAPAAGTGSTATAEPAQRRQLRNYLLDRSYQLRFTLAMVLVSAVLTAMLGLVVVYFLDEASRTVYLSAQMDPGFTERDALELRRQLAAGDHVVMIALTGFGVLFGMLMAGYGIVLTHKVAGPLYKISNHMADVREGRFLKIRDLRKGDQLVQFFGAFREMHAALAKREQDEVTALDGAIAEADKAGAATAVEALRALRDRKLARIQGP